ncbi:JHE-like carboxylesterase 1 [Penaeus vannamei]|uniref:JHE-like carboxylesterase 1 n=1 Tax=Penaeus vannamei TaxID=6689 RepID=A0A3R7QQ39_PENVA|nr:venom carboxylesterase-6-like [Penaeus vannamei]ROT74375.1 JHE-like carboxylesterase 1 [Penaeus vannamei]
MVWIHGGGFVFGGAEDYKPYALVAKDVVVVLIQYRLGTLGFLSTEDSELPGNLGLQDQTLALRWVKDNIRDLGGDPDKVTLFGESAGGASVHFHVLSPMSEGLFRRAIMQSGTMLCPWAMREGHRGVAAKLAEVLSCSGVSVAPVLDSAALLSCLRGASAEQLIMAQSAFNIWGFAPQVMLPRVDGLFLPDHPATLLREGRYNKVDIISGVTRNEGTIVTARTLLIPDFPELMLQNFSVAGPLEGGFDQEENPEYLARRAYHHYLGSPLQFTMEKAEEYTQLHTDHMFGMCHLDVVKHHLREEAYGHRVFTYELQHRGEFTLMDLFMGPSEIGKEWVGHGDDIQYLFEAIMDNFTLTRQEDLLVKQIMVDLWTSFAATGHPTPDLSLGFRWDPTTKDRDSYLAITPAPDMRAFGNHAAQRFWRNMPTKANKLMYPQRFSRCLG